MKKLSQLGFVWGARDEKFERHFSALKAFYKREGHSRVPKRWVENGLELGNWVQTVRSAEKFVRTPERMLALASVQFAWNAFDQLFELNMAALRSFVDREGHARVPQRWREGDIGLGVWVAKLRMKPGSVSPAKRAELEALGFVWKVGRGRK
jgi:hypothetical protein